MLEPDVETLPWRDQIRLDDALYRKQIAYLMARSRFYQSKLREAGFDTAEKIGGLDAIADLPLTEKSEIRASCSDAEPMGRHVAAPIDRIVRIYSTSGTTGTPSYIPLTAQDLDNWVTTSARSYSASGIRQGEAIVSTYNAGPFAAGAALAAFDRLGMCHIPVGTGNTERLVTAIRLLRPSAAVMTPSYAAYLSEWAADRGFDLKSSSVRRLLVAGEPGGGEPKFRTRLEDAWGAKVTEAMGIGDIGVSLWGECEEQCGMHLGARGLVHAELIDPETELPIALADGVKGELVLTHLRHQAAPMLRFRTRDHVEMWTSTCRCGRTAPRVRCIGRTDDLLIVRGVNVFPSAIRDVVNEFAPAVSGAILITPVAAGARQEPPLPVSVELARDSEGIPALADKIQKRIRDVLVVSTRIEIVPWGTLQRSEYKSKLVQHQAG
ncbi:phenylacetate-coenzyme A ligase PaaK (plasmid) [Sinorhizobium americanum CCGM7]|uniref:phenylacetate--CoA ligase family protein n=1 Tax=Sinorhizobium americanum TaxID=194963 RepID=UPI0004D67A69|nr:AMP-binding protein [Sinorhizobium americanum]APG88915.1 phenylacetate-coenzyme A ligase PaaK [Sinorhizobium americanum CCGM7]